MKSAIAALIIAASATACDNYWVWEECSGMEYRDLCDGECGDDGWMYWDAEAWEEFCVSYDEFASWDWCSVHDGSDLVPCYEWIWEECSWSWYRNLCDGECDDDGWMYWDAEKWEEFCVSVDDFISWNICW